MSQYVFHEPDHSDFDKHGAHGKFFPTNSPLTQHLILQTNSADGYDMALRERDCEFNYYILEGSGEVVIDGSTNSCKQGDLIVIPPGHTFTFNGNFKLLLINTPHYSPGQEEELPKDAA